MGKMLNAILIVVVIELAMILFLGCVGLGCETNTSIMAFLLNPQDWSLSTFLGVISDNIFLIGGGVAITVGAAWVGGGGLAEFLVYAGLSSILFGFGKVFIPLWQKIAAIGFFGDVATGGMIATILLAPLIVYFIWGVLDFARGRD